jgi:hypothetical protein
MSYTNPHKYLKDFWPPAFAGDSLEERINSERTPCEGRSPVLSGFKDGWYYPRIGGGGDDTRCYRFA